MTTAASGVKKTISLAALAVSLGVLAVMGWLVFRDSTRTPLRPLADRPPEVEFTWSPLGPVTLQEFKGFLSLQDDHALDFTTYKFRIVEIDKTIGLPIEGMIGREYTSDIYLSWLVNNAKVLESDHLTFEISVADDKGQETKITRMVKLKPAAGVPVLVKP